MEPKREAGIKNKEDSFQGPQLETRSLVEVYIDGVACHPLFFVCWLCSGYIFGMKESAFRGGLPAQRSRVFPECFRAFLQRELSCRVMNRGAGTGFQLLHPCYCGVLPEVNSLCQGQAV